VFGAGAIGGALAAQMATAPGLAGVTVSLTARGAHLNAIQNGGLRLWRKGAEQPIVARVKASADARALGEQDLVITALKGHQLPAAAEGVAALLGPRTRVLTVLNGVPWWYFYADAASGRRDERIERLDPGGRLWDLIGPERVIGGVAFYGAEVIAPGEVRLNNDVRLTIGEPSGGSSDDLAATAALLERAGAAVTQSAQIRNDIWFKLIGNAAFNPISVLTRATLSDMGADEAVVAIIRLIMAEVKAVGSSLGARIVGELEERIAQSRRLGPFRSSMLQDFERGRPLETEPLIDAVIDLGRLTGVPTPTLQTIAALIGLLAKTARMEN
jgi:2-dehydropantoate 2-reductase